MHRRVFLALEVQQEAMVTGEGEVQILPNVRMALAAHAQQGVPVDQGGEAVLEEVERHQVLLVQVVDQGVAAVKRISATEAITAVLEGEPVEVL